MAREDDLKKIELKVSVNCCDGCKKKVLKALSVKGVLKIEIHPTLPQVIVTGNVDPQTLVKKLARYGKMAEVLSKCQETKMAEVLSKNQETTKKNDGEQLSEKKSASGGEHEKKPGLQDTDKKNFCNTGKSNQLDDNGGNNIDGDSKSKKALAREDDSRNPNTDVATPIKPVTATSSMSTVSSTAPTASDHTASGMVEERTHQQTYYPQTHYSVEPCIVPMTRYIPNPYNTAPPHLCYAREHWYHELPLYYHQPAVQPLPQSFVQPPRLTEYFNDDNTVGCHIM